MSKITKREYLELKNNILDKIEYVKSELDKLDNIGSENVTEEVGEYWNSLHDRQYDLEQELRFLDDRWDKRNWSVQEHYQNDLIMNNID